MITRTLRCQVAGIDPIGYDLDLQPQPSHHDLQTAAQEQMDKARLFWKIA